MEFTETLAKSESADVSFSGETKPESSKRVRVWRGDDDKSWRYHCPCCKWYSAAGGYDRTLILVRLHLRVHQS